MRIKMKLKLFLVKATKQIKDIEIFTFSIKVLMMIKIKCGNFKICAFT